MRAAITALSWELVARYRWLYVVAASWLLLVSALGLLLSTSGCDPLVGVSLVMSLCAPLLFVLGGLAHGWDTHLENAGSCFPSRLFTLPVPVGFLVGPPLLLGTAVVVASWLLAALCMLRPFGMEDIPLWWPALCGAAVLAWIQAVTWFPFPLPWLRLVCLTVFLGGLFFGTLALISAGRDFGGNEALLAGLFLTLLVLGYATAAVGVDRARRGMGTHEPFQLGAVVIHSDRQLPAPFSSPLRAQMWLEWQVNGWVFFFVVGLCVVVTLPQMYFTDKALRGDFVSVLPPWVGRAREAVGTSWLAMGYMLVGPFLLALCGGSGMGKAALRYNDRACPPFLGTRPISTPDMVRAKLIVSAVGVVCAWAILVIAAIAWAVSMGRVSEMADRLIDLTGSAWAAIGALVGGQLLLMAMAWLGVLSGLWLGALGRPMLTGALAILGMFALAGLGVLLASWRESWWPVLDSAIVVCLVGKALVVGWVSRQLRRERFVQLLTLTYAIAAWMVFAALVSGVAVWLTSGGARVAGITLLLLPLARPLAAPLALARNRTR